MIGWFRRRRPEPQPSCFGTNPSPQEAAENDCHSCRQQEACFMHWLGGEPPVTPSTLDFAFGGKVWPGLAKLAEEKDEVGQVLAKLIQTGGDPAHWSGNMVDKLVEELPDLLAAVKVFVELNPVLHQHGDAMRERFEMKVARFRAWHFETLEGRL